MATAKAQQGVITIRGLQEADLGAVRNILDSLPGLHQMNADTTRGRIELEFDGRRYGILTATMLLRRAGFPAVVGEHG